MLAWRTRVKICAEFFSLLVVNMSARSQKCQEYSSTAFFAGCLKVHKYIHLKPSIWQNNQPHYPGGENRDNGYSSDFSLNVFTELAEFSDNFL